MATVAAASNLAAYVADANTGANPDLHRYCKFLQHKAKAWHCNLNTPRNTETSIPSSVTRMGEILLSGYSSLQNFFLHF
jgi:hypothetical protein